jgi:hypothetical protein
MWSWPRPDRNAQALQQASGTVPIIFADVIDPGSGFLRRTRSIVADARCRLPPRRPLPCRREFRRRAGKALD